MTASSVPARRRAVALVAVAAVAAAVGAVAWPSGGRAEAPAAAGTETLPMLGVADERTTIFGTISEGSAAGESWALAQLPVETPEPVTDGATVGFGSTDADKPTPQLALLRHTEAAGWQVAAVPQTAAGAPSRGPAPNVRSARMSGGGAAVLVGQDTTRPADEQAVVIARDPGGAFVELAPPTTSVLLPADIPAAGDPAEQLAGERGSGRVHAAVADRFGRAVVMVAPVGRAREDAVLVHHDGAWSRELVELPDAPSEFRVVALAAETTDRAWLVGSSPGRPIRLFRRDVAAVVSSWREVELPVLAWTDEAAAASAGLTELAPLAGQAQTLTVAGERVWVDLAARDAAGEQHATLLVDPGAPLAARVKSWCDVEGSCDEPLGAAFSTLDGYRSYAWAGEGDGTRVITNPLTRPGASATNRGTWLRLTGSVFERLPGGGGNYRPSGAFFSPQSGWLGGPVQVGAAAAPARLAAWPTALRSPLTAVASEPGKQAGALTTGALAAGSDGAVLRYSPDRGWTREFLLSSSGSVVRAALRGVAWPEPSRAHAVGDLGAIWQWRADTGLWERDPATPVGFEGNLMAIAFDPADPYRGFAVGKGGVLLAYDKSWSQQVLPDGFGDANFTAVTFSGRQAIAVSDRGVLVSDGGGSWRVDAAASALLAGLPGETPTMVAASGLTDGGAVLAGRTVVLERDGADQGWRVGGQPLTGLTVTAAAAVRDGEHVRAVVAVVPTLRYPIADVPIEVEEGTPPPLIPPYALPGDGYLLRETATGWRDEQRSAFGGSGEDRPTKADPVLALALDPAGAGWAIGGWSGVADNAGRGTSAVGSAGKAVRTRVQTAAVLRYDPAGAPASAPAAVEADIPLEGNVVRLAIGGHPQCAAACADLATQAIAPDRMLVAALDLAERLAARPGGPRAFISTGGRIAPGRGHDGDGSELRRFADLLRPRVGLPVYNAVSQGDVSAGSSGAHRDAFAAAAAPYGSTGALGISTDGVPTGPAPGGARTHYAFDTTGVGGAVRVVVIDNSAGSLAASDPHQVPAEPQETWLTAVLDDAKAEGIAAIVVGSRDLNPRARPALNVASDGDRIAQLLVDHGASAYFFDRPEENRSGAVPAGAAVTIPTYGTGTLGYRSGVDDAESIGLPDAMFGDSGFLLAEVDVARREPATNRAPVNVRLVPVIESLSLDAIDGTLLRRSRPSLFKGLGRRPIAGDRWGRSTGDGIPSPTGADPYTVLPAEACVVGGCSTRIEPEYSFRSSDPDVLDMVAVDPATANQRKPLLGADDKVVTDAQSGLVCPFNAGTTTVTLAAGGRAISQSVTVLAGSVMRPCGTRPLDPSKIRTIAPKSVGAVAPPPPASPPPSLLPSLVPPPPPAPAPEKPAPKPKAPAPEPPLFFAGFTTPVLKAAPNNSVSPPPPAAGFFAQPIPPGGATVRVTEEKRETEIATEQSQAYAAIGADDRLPVEPFIGALALIAALAGTTIRPGRRRGPAYARVRTTSPRHPVRPAVRGASAHRPTPSRYRRSQP